MFYIPSPTSSASGATFSDPAPWDEHSWVGPAVNMPKNLWNLQLRPEYFVEFLRVSPITETPNKKPGQTEMPRKNHRSEEHTSELQSP